MSPQCHLHENRKPDPCAFRHPDPARPPCGGWHASPRTENTPRSRFAFLPRLDRSLVRQQMSRNSLITLGQPLTPRKGSTSTSASKDPPVTQRVLLNFRRHYTIPHAVAQGGNFKNLFRPVAKGHIDCAPAFCYNPRREHSRFQSVRQFRRWRPSKRVGVAAFRRFRVVLCGALRCGEIVRRRPHGRRVLGGRRCGPCHGPGAAACPQARVVHPRHGRAEPHADVPHLRLRRGFRRRRQGIRRGGRRSDDRTLDHPRPFHAGGRVRGRVPEPSPP